MASKIFRATRPDIIDLPDVDLATDIFANPYGVSPDEVAFISAESGQKYTYGVVQQRVKSLAHGLRSLGVQEGDVVAFFSPNSIDYAVVCFAVIGCGATVATISAGLTAEEFHDQIETAQAEFVIADSALLQTAQKAAEGTTVKQVIQADGESHIHGVDTANNLATRCPPSELFSIPPTEAATRPAFLCFSSGTTGKSKGAMITHKNMTSNMRQWEGHHHYVHEAGKMQVAFLPLSHIYGLNFYLCSSVRRGRTSAIIRHFSPDVYLNSIQKYRPADLQLVPPVALLLTKDPRVEQYDLSSVRTIMSAAAPLSKELGLAVEARFRKLWGTTMYCYQAWGLTETSPAITGLAPECMDRRATVGSIIPNVEMRVVNPETLEDVQFDVKTGWTNQGEIWIAGPNITLGYLRNDAATRDAFHVGVDGKRWFRSGDIGSIDGEGYIVLQDRSKEMIKYKGLQVIPSELEGKLLEHPYVADCAVLGRWVEDQATELPVAFIVLTEEAKIKGIGAAVAEIQKWLNGRIANYKRLRGGVKVTDAIPKSAAGKILRRQLKDQIAAVPKASKL